MKCLYLRLFELFLLIALTERIEEGDYSLVLNYAIYV